MPKPHLYYCSFVISFEIFKCEFTIFVPFQNCVGCLGPLSIPYELEDEFLHFWEKKKNYEDFDTNYVDSLDHFG